MARTGIENNQGNMTEHSINEMIQESKLLESYYNDIISKESLLHRLLEESTNSFEALKNLSLDSDTLSLVPLGIGVYVKSAISPINKVLVNVGAGVIIEKKKDDAVNFIEHRIKEFETAAKQLSTQKQQISYRMMEIQNTVNSYVGQIQGRDNSVGHHLH
jgi:prefoldin alpha subunit